MARCSKKQKRAVILRRKRILKRCFFSFEKSSFLVKTVLWNKIKKLDVAFKEYNRNPRRVGRKRSTDWCDNGMLQMEDFEFIANFRLSRPSFEKLCNQLRPLTVKEETFAKNTVSVERRVAMTLYFLGQGINYRTVANQFGVAVSTACHIIHQTTKAIVDILTPEYIKFPENDAEYLAAMATFQCRQIPNCVGAIDGSHIRILRPTECSTDFYNRKGYYSILLQGICDGDGKFLSVSCGYPGSIHDARMLRRSGFYKNVLNKRWI